MMSALQFWILWNVLFLFVVTCSMMNANLHTYLKTLLPWFQKIYLPKLLASEHSADARSIKRDQIPLFEEWEKACGWYSFITFTLQILLLILASLMTFSVGVPYILLMVIVMLLGSTVMFFPRTIIRRANVKAAVGFYFLAHAKLLCDEVTNSIQNGAIENSEHDKTGNSRTDTYS